MPEGHHAPYDENKGVEIVAEPKIPELQRGTACAIHINHKPQTPRPDDFGEPKIVFKMPPLRENPMAVPR